MTVMGVKPAGRSGMRMGRNPADIFARMKGVVVLVGAVRPSGLMAGIQRSVLDLPLNTLGEKLLDRWMREVRQLMDARGIGHMTLKVMLDAGSTAPAVRPASEHLPVVVARDPFEYRGTGGVLHDVARELEDEDYLVVVSGAQLLSESLMDLVGSLAEGADVGIVGQRNGTPSGLMLVRCGVLRGISDLGYVDLKEQALPAIAKKFQVIVGQRELASMPVRTTRDYVTALRHDHRRQRGEMIQTDPFAEDWHSEFSVVEPGSHVDASARLFDSVVLAGGRVNAGAVLVRTVVCPGGVVRAGQRLVDQLVDGRGGTP
ncbi:MAG TPA: hypothetical protein VHM90_06155 [Phycisphaerae bacterium]|jgi:hypothetical protein|nr:hypothetical protein [Phycisphaerae bacterium]